MDKQVYEIKKNNLQEIEIKNLSDGKNEIVFDPKNFVYNEKEHCKVNFFGIVLLKYFLSKDFNHTAKQYLNERNDGFEYNKLRKKMLEMKFTEDMIKYLIGFFANDSSTGISKDIPTDMFFGNRLININVKSNETIIEEVRFEIDFPENWPIELINKVANSEFIDKESIKFENIRDLKNYVKFVFWGTAKLNGEKIPI